jgi:acyl carrier protein
VNWSIAYEIGDVAPSWASIPYGTPMANQRYHILDAQLAHRPVWTPGQMYVSSEVGLAKGYWRDEAQTRERFLTLPGTGERAYATGDIGRYLADGTIEILGRADFQVKVQGHRIELGEIEAALERCPLVSAAAVVAPTHARSGRRLTAFAVVEQGPGGADTAAALAELGAHLRTLLPAYLVPPDIRAVEELPLTRNGKVDRRALEALARHRPTAGLTDRRPVGTLEQIVAEEFAQTLDLPEVARHDNFFQLGGDSLSGTRLAARLTETFGVDVPLRLVFVLPTVADLAAGLATDPHTGPTVTALVEALASLDASDLTSILQDCAAAAEPGAAD